MAMTESQQRWEAWFDAFTRIRDAWPERVEPPCPDGDGGRLHITYTGSPESRIGFATLWCDAAHDGIFLSRVGIPEDAEMLSFDATPEERAAVIPEIRLIPPDPYDG
ncbi:hypothetical protein [Paractinoplanes brasiliensis]|uniref:Uncharacterized protein n=1 Tax=Paractinoplanes brasiliensis TaxID=52695 RepID=A0A4R6JRJ6_9ACTN|nr:hypothetical protein [Actinoplanes brasiliensis]TDO38031.1 hypothetical protein C8E87_1673 [Actinoplanes brasiliensis]GID31122.1 hypothetical protein Abr02nite_61050 [Actinoplanes brasiliensis]